MNWQTKKLSEICNFSTIKNSEFLPYVGMEDIESDTGKLLIKPENKKVKSTTSYFDESCILYGKLRPYLNKVFLPTFRGHCTTEFVTIRPNENQLSREWLAKWLMSPFVVDEMSKNISGARMPRADLNYLKNLQIPLPSLDTQHQIVGILEEKFAKLREAKQLREEAIVDTEKILSQTLREIFKEGKEKGWEEKEIKDICEHPQYGFTASSTTEPVGPKMLRITDIQNGKVDWNTVPYCKCDNVEKYQLKKDDIVFARTGATVGKSFLITDDPNNTVFASYLIRLRTKEKVSAEFLYYFFQSLNYWEQITKNAVGGAQPNVNGTKLANLKILIPSFAEQQKIVTRLDSLSKKLRTLRDLQTSQLEDLKKLEKAYLREAFRGELID